MHTPQLFILAKSTSCAVVGLDAALIEVEVDIGRVLASIAIVGLPDTAVQESRERVGVAIRNTGLHFPDSRLTIDLAFADLRKEGPAYDLPIAVDMLLASEQIFGDLDRAVIMGELSLDGSVRNVSGVRPMARAAREEGCKALYVLAEDTAEASLIDGLEVYPTSNLLALIDHLTGQACLAPYQRDYSLEEAEDRLFTLLTWRRSRDRNM